MKREEEEEEEEKMKTKDGEDFSICDNNLF